MAAAVRERVYNHEQKDYATFLKTADETDDEYTLLEIELAPGGGNPLHAHSAFTELFTVLEGELNVQLGKEHLVLKAGDKALVPLNTNHRFYSTSERPTHFLVELRPGHRGFEQTIRIGYGISGIKLNPIKNLLALGVLIDMSDTGLVGLAAVFRPVFGLLANIARRIGFAQELEARFGKR